MLTYFLWHTATWLERFGMIAFKMNRTTAEGKYLSGRVLILPLGLRPDSGDNSQKDHGESPQRVLIQGRFLCASFLRKGFSRVFSLRFIGFIRIG